jgi:lantibiotic modifying enzyme
MHDIIHDRLKTVHRILQSTSSLHNTFFSGRLGLLFYYYQAYQATGNSDFCKQGEQLLETVFEELNSGNPGLVRTALSTGGAGLGYVVNALHKQNLITFEVDDEFEELDRYLFHSALSQIEEDAIDYLHGALGVLHYFNDRVQTPVVNAYVNTLVEKLCERAVYTDAGLWFKNHVIQLDKKNDINFGLAHGLTGILMILINAWPHVQNKDLVKNVVKEGIRFILRHKIDVDFSNEEYTAFPFSIKQQASEISATNRLAWCYGDLSEVLLFYRSYQLLEDAQLTSLADLIGTQTLLRKTATATLVEDAHFCHGASGLAQFYRTLYLETGNAAYQKGYEYWIEQTVLLLDRDLKEGKWNGKEHHLIDGLLGIAFTLLSYVSNNELQWSKAFLL